jgi:hypothetical protein
MTTTSTACASRTSSSTPRACRWGGPIHAARSTRLHADAQGRKAHDAATPPRNATATEGRVGTRKSGAAIRTVGVALRHPRLHPWRVRGTRRYSTVPTDRWSRTGESLRAARSSAPASSCRRRHVASPHFACCAQRVAVCTLHVACCVVCCVADDPGTLPSYSQEGLARPAVVFAIDATGTRPRATLRH